MTHWHLTTCRVWLSSSLLLVLQTKEVHQPHWILVRAGHKAQQWTWHHIPMLCLPPHPLDQHVEIFIIEYGYGSWKRWGSIPKLLDYTRILYTVYSHINFNDLNVETMSQSHILYSPICWCLNLEIAKVFPGVIMECIFIPSSKLSHLFWC